MKIKSNAWMFGLLLKNELASRCKKNPSYSLRAFAKQLDIDPSHLSKIIKGQKIASQDMIIKIGPLIGIKTRDLNKLLKGEEISYNLINDDSFRFVGDWYHFAILELLKVHSFEHTEEWISDRLGLDQSIVSAALERLCRLNFIEISEGQILAKTPDHTWSTNMVTTEARKNLQKELNKKAIDAIENVPFEWRENGSLTVACSKELLPEIRDRIIKFRRELDSFIGSHPQHEDVYQLTVSFFPLTKIEQEAL